MRRRDFIAGLGSAAAWPACGAGAAGGPSTALRRVDERRSGGFLPAGSPFIGADEECRGIGVREQSSAWIAQDLAHSLSDL
jgi:hypothetical protein